MPAAEAHGEECTVCRLLEDERRAGARVVLEASGLVAICPYASRAPYELLIAPLAHEGDGFESALLGGALAVLSDALRRLVSLEGPRPLNAWLHPTRHWHLEALPRLTVWAGIELGAGIYVNPLPPEEAASALRAVDG